MKAIETVYRGYRFRSRTEARWAVFFDALDIDWEYEPEGFEFPNGIMYLPDFKIGNIWVEIKADAPSADEEFKMVCLVSQSKMHGLILCGSPGKQRVFDVLSRDFPVMVEWGSYDTEDIAEALCLALSRTDFRARFDIRQKVGDAIQKSRSARFEHDERASMARV